MPIASRNQRSWETATIVLGLLASAVSSTSSVSKSRWLVGSSSSSRSAWLATSAAIAARARWPGLRRSSGRRIASASRPKWASSVRASDSSMPGRGVAAEPLHQRAGGVEGLRAGAGGRRRISTWPRSAAASRAGAQQRGLAGAVGAGDGDALAAVEREVDVVEDAGAGALQARDAAAAVGGGVELQAHGGRLARALDPVGRRHLALEPVLARLRLLGDLLGEPLLMAARPRGRRCARCGGRARGCRRCRPRACGGACPGPCELLEARAAAGLLVAVGGVAAVVGGRARRRVSS